MNALLRTPVAAAGYALHRMQLRRRLATAPAEAPTPARILVIALDNIGDSLLLTPALTALGESRPNASITVLATGYNARIFEGHPAVETIWRVEGGTVRAARADTFTMRDVWRANPRLVRRLWNARFDAAVVCETNRKQIVLADGLAYLAGVPLRSGPEFGGDARRFTHTVDGDNVARFTQYYVDLMRPVSGKAEISQETYHFWITGGDREQAAGFLRTHHVDPEKPLAVMHPGGRLYATPRRWAPERFAAVADGLARKFNATIVFTGDEDDVECIQAIQDTMSAASVSVAGLSSLGATAALVERSRCVVTNDTAVMHIAAAIDDGPGVVAIFGSTDPDKIAPAVARCHVVRATIACAPCFVSATTPPPACTPVDGRTPCFEEITVDAVLAAVETAWNAGRRPT